MAQMYKVFFNDKLVLLTDEHISERKLSGYIAVHFDHIDEILTTIQIVRDTDVIKGLILFSEDLELLWKDFQSQFTIVEAAGGLVFNSAGEVLMIYRNGKWDLPKGKRETGESIETGALREVEEECGVLDLKLGRHLINTYHHYTHNEKEILKPTYWYEMRSEQTNLIPQLEEGITKVEWMKIEKATLDKLDTYPNIKLVLEAAQS